MFVGYDRGLTYREVIMMNNLNWKRISFLVFFLCAHIPSSHAKEKWYEYDHLYLQGGSYIHLNNNEDFDGPNFMLGLEAVKTNDRFYGLFVFDNSFGQFSQYAYIGKKWNFSGEFTNFHTKLTAGIIHGYKEPWNNKLPFTTKDGWSPGIIPSMGYQKGKIGFDVMLLGYQGVMFSVGTNF